MCKYDDGTMKFSDTFRSFSKLRLSCSKKIDNEVTTFDYNELQSLFFDRTTNLIYGAFNLPKYERGSHAGSPSTSVVFV